MNSDDIKCPICLEMIVLPVTLLCGHTFCKGCEQKNDTHISDTKGDLFKSCPLCRFPYSGEPQVNVVLNDVLETVMGETYINECNNRLIISKFHFEEISELNKVFPKVPVGESNSIVKITHNCLVIEMKDK